MRKPLYPTDGQEYMQAMLEAAEEYDAWVESRKGRKRIKVWGYTVKKGNETYADI